ncbi:hypothetical protein [Bacteroides acidifaciens]|uniref:hypothetical protein n=1 Tax=Bacteroides acidifaciens TaxID=85831 RepID=UPI0025A596BE|nr:hypothetical protein [Bacteroides acidifaciens]
MVAKISVGSSLYGAIAYNGEKINRPLVERIRVTPGHCKITAGHEWRVCGV